jgi:ABC-type Na+ transport system ATPase subunit NatA
MFSKSTMQKDTNYDFLRQKLSDKFLIPDNGRSKVIFGYNGIGKTSIYRYIRDHKGDPRMAFLDYVDERDTFIKHKKKIQVTADLRAIHNLDDEISRIKDSMGISKGLSSNFGITSVAKAKNYGNIIKAAQKDQFDGFAVTRNDMKSICDSLSGIEPRILLNNRQALDEVVNYIDEMAEYRSSLVFQSLVLLDQVVSGEDVECPVCETNIINIKEKIQDKMRLLDHRKSVLVENLKKDNIQLTEENFGKLIKTTRLLSSESLLAEWMICNGDIDRFDSLVEQQRILTKKIKERDSLVAAVDRLYQNLAQSKNLIKSDISRYFGIDSDDISFDDTEKQLTIELPREVKTYSTGEMNLLSFLIRIYEFIGSDKSILILDDPVSSLDIINHYKIVYEIVKTANSGKIVIIFTHSIEMINAVHSQYSKDFDYYYIDEDSESLDIQEIPKRSNGSNLLTLEILLKEDEKGIIAAMIDKENANNNDEIHKLFHYDESFFTSRYPDISNDYFVRIIEDYTPISNKSFVCNSYNKVIYVAALRVWVEKQIRDLLVKEPGLLDEFQRQNTLAKKIGVLLRRDGSSSVPIPEGLNRNLLMSKKVMLNQGVHYQSQVMPFAYALNISIRELNSEIMKIKAFFD